jgi:hypothetical protein
VEKDNKKTSQGKDKSPKEGKNLGKDCFGQGISGGTFYLWSMCSKFYYEYFSCEDLYHQLNGRQTHSSC